MFFDCKFMAVLCLLSPLSGCGGGSGTVASQTTTGRYQSLQFSATSRTVYKRGESVIVTLVIKNASADPFVFSYGGCAPDQAQVQQNSQTIATFDDLPAGTGCTAQVKTATLAAGQTFTYRQVWDQQVPSATVPAPATPALPGTYQIVSGIPSLTGGGVLGAAPLTVTIQ